MFSYNNTHIFTGYLKQLLSSFNLPTCKIYTNDFAQTLLKSGKEDARVVESFDPTTTQSATRICYLKNDELCYYFWDKDGTKKWKRIPNAFYTPERALHGLTRSLNSIGKYYDTATHEYLGDYLRFLRDYYNINLMSMYNCFNNKIYNNIYFNFIINPNETNPKNQIKITFDAQDSSYKIYAVPVKLFSKYTIAIDCSQGVELFCGLYNTRMELSDKANKLAAKTYVKINQTIFNQPFLYDKLCLNNLSLFSDIPDSKSVTPADINDNTITRWDIITREKDLKLFIKVPNSCKSSVVILEGDYRGFNDARYIPSKYIIKGESQLEKTAWNYTQNHCVLNFNTGKKLSDSVDLNNYAFVPISRLQLLSLNTGESYPFADRLIEYLSGSAITPIEEISDNIKRVQRVMRQNGYYFKIEGLWENKMQNILYDYMINAGPIVVVDGKLKDKRTGKHPTLGYTTKSTLFDILGYIDKDTEKLYSSWRKQDKRAVIKDNIQNIDIYDGLYDL